MVVKLILFDWCVVQRAKRATLLSSHQRGMYISFGQYKNVLAISIFIVGSGCSINGQFLDINYYFC